MRAASAMPMTSPTPTLPYASSGVTISSTLPADSCELNELTMPAAMSKIASQRSVEMLMSQTQTAK